MFETLILFGIQKTLDTFPVEDITLSILVWTDDQSNVRNISNFGLETVSIAFLNTNGSVEKITYVY